MNSNESDGSSDDLCKGLNSPYRPPVASPSDKNEPATTNSIAFFSDHSPAPFVLPFIMFMVLSMFAPSFDPLPTEEQFQQLSAEQLAEAADYTASRNSAKATQYSVLIALQVLLGFGLLFYFSRSYFRQFPFRISVWGFLAGIIGCVLWIAICKMEIEHSALDAIGLGSWLPKRVGFDPSQINSTSQYATFLGFRFLLLAGLVPIIEELFLRGWLMRIVDDEQWWTQSLIGLSMKACIAATIYGVLTHPGEVVAAAVWFSAVTLMMKRTGNFWDCVVAHASTNLLLGIWVLNSGDWFLW